MWRLCAICAVLISAGWGLGGVAEETSYVYEIYAEKANTNRSVACGVCEDRGGRLAHKPGISDWEMIFGNWSHLANRTFWVDVMQTVTGEWLWGGVELVSSDISELPMNPDYSGNYSGWHCALWTPVEPFLQPANCSLATNILCQRSADLASSSECDFRELPGMKITGLTTVTTAASKDECVAACRGREGCWAGHWKDADSCSLLTGQSQTDHPAVPDMENDGDFVAFGKTCLHILEMAPEDSEFVCNCAAVQIPETQEEKEQFLEEYDQKVKEELVVPTETLSATIRKKESAPDERPSSTSMGYLGVTLMVIVFGGLVLMDLTSLGAHCKMGASNVKKALVHEEETGVSEA